MMGEPNEQDLKVAHELILEFADRENMSRLRVAIAAARAAARAEGEAAERKVWMQWADGLTGHKLYLASAMRRQITTALEAAAGSKTKVFSREDEQKNLG